VSALVTIIHVIICLILIIAVLLQSGKAADLAGAFGGAGSATAFGPRGSANLLSKVTTVGAILFMATSLTLWVLSSKGTKSAVSGETAAPVKPAAAAADTTKPAAVKTGEAKPATDQAAPKTDVQKKEPATTAPGQPAPKTDAQKPAATPPAPEPKKK
jgi:preprotein translocase subunit SecG